jgi:hypothetical protein
MPRQDVPQVKRDNLPRRLHAPARSTTSTPTARRPPSTTASKSPPSNAYSPTTPTAWPSLHQIDDRPPHRRAGAVEAIATICALQAQLAHPTINLNDPDPECDLDFVPNTARAMKMDVALSNSFAFGGQCASLVLGRG